MATNKPFDVRIVNPLERPTSNDFNLAQSVARGSVESLANAVFNPGGFVGRAGFIGSGFQARAYDTPAMDVLLLQGLGFQFQNTPEFTDLDGVIGVDDITGAHMTPLYLSQGFGMTVPAAPTDPTKCRRDLIVVKSAAKVTDATPSDRFNPISQNFVPQSYKKTATWDLYDYPVQYIDAGSTPAESSPVVYIKGAEALYTNADSFSTTALTPTIPTGYMPVAAINVSPNMTVVFNSAIIDARRLLFPADTASVSFHFEGGCAPAGPPYEPGTFLGLYSAMYPDGMRFNPTISRNFTDTNSYTITIPMSALNAYVATAQADILNLIPVPDTGVTPTMQFDCRAVVTGIESELLTQAHITALMDPDFTWVVPTRQPAVGQPVLRVLVSLCVQKQFDLAGTPTAYLDPAAIAFAVDGLIYKRTVGATCTVQLKRNF